MPIWKRRPALEELRLWQRGTLDEALGIEIIEIGEDYVRGRMPVDERTRQPFGLLHGGASVALAESLGSLAANLCLEPGSSIAVGLDVNANHTRPVTRGHVTGTARPIHLGRATQVWEIRIEDDQGRLCCVARLTVAITAKQ